MKVCGIVTICLLGIAFIVVGLVFPQVFPGIMEKQLGKKLLLRPDSPTIGNFLSPPIPIFMQFYFFNVTNPKGILNGDTPVLNQMGPFTYEEKRLKYDLLWETHDATVTYKQNKTFFFRPELSNGLDEDTLITVINPVLISLAAKVSNVKYEFAKGLFELIKLRFELHPFITRKAGELLFHGYQEDILAFASTFTGDPIHATGKFGFFYPKNGSNDGTYKVGTGADGLENLQIIDEWRGSPTLHFWKTDVCNMINGTEGSQFPRPITPDTQIRMYSSDLCRSLYFNFEKKVYHGNLELYRYILPYDVLAQTPENECFCADEFTCRDSMVNLSPCKKGSPVLASTPHFYMGANESINAIVGLNPSKFEHETFLDIEPNTGVTFQAHKRIQISMPLKRYSALSALSKVKEVILPIVWLNESALVPEDRANALYSKLTMPTIVVGYVCMALMALGTLLLILAVTLAVRNFKAQHQAPNKSKHNGNLKNAPVNEYDRSEGYKHLFVKT
uniref:Lysosome membrane protein 2-like n=1 Tax=Hirondellea gigas TaxID=1518452 RepID=A0A2P2HY80_9CRUS